MLDYQKSEIRKARETSLSAPDHVNRCAAAAAKGFRFATLDEWLTCPAEDIYRWRGGLWCRATERAA